MADRYWVGGAGTWDASSTTNWSTSSGGAGGASAPTVADNVIFDALSNATGYTVTVGTNAACLDLNAIGPLTGNVTFSAGATARIDCRGSFTFLPSPTATVTWTGSAGALVTFSATTTGKTVTTNGVNLTATNITFNGVGGAWTLGSALTIGTSQNLIVTNGTFNTGNYNITGASFAVNAVGTQVINLGSSTLTLSNGATPLTFSQTAGLTFNAGTSSIVCSGASPTFAGGGQTFYNVSFTSNASGTSTITGANTFNNLNQTSINATGIRVVILGANQTVNGTLTFGAANTAIRRILVISDVIGTQRTITLNGTLATLADVDFRNIATAGTVGTWSGTRLGNALGNSGITFDASKDVYWNLVGGGNWSATGWATTSGGTPNVNNFPLAQDKAIIENTGLNTSATITVDVAWSFGEIDASTRTNAMTLGIGVIPPRIYKNFTLSSAVTLTGTSSWQFSGQGTTQILDTNTATFTPNFIIDSPSGTLQLAENTTCSGTVTLTQGTLDLNNNILTCNIFGFSGSLTKVIAFGTSKIVVTGNNTTVVVMGSHVGFSYTGTSRIELSYSGSVGTRAIGSGVTSATESTAVNFYVTAGTDIVSVTGNTGTNVYRTLDFTGFAGSVIGAHSVAIYRDLIFSSGMTVGVITSGISFLATSGIQQVTTNNKTLDFAVSQNGVGGTVQLQDNLTMGSTRLFTQTNGTLDLNNQTFSTGFFSSNNSNIRVIAFGTGKIVVTGNNATVLNLSFMNNFSYTGTPNFELTYSGSTGTRTYSFGQNGGVTEANAVNITIIGGSDTITTGSISRIRNETFSGFTGTAPISPFIYGNLTLSSGMTISASTTGVSFVGTTGTQLITTSGKTLDFAVSQNGVGGTVQLQDNFTMGSTRQFSLANGTLDLNNLTFSTGTFNSSYSNIRSIAFGTGNITTTGTGTVWGTSTSTNFSFTGTPTVNISNNSATATAIQTAGMTEAQSLNFNFTTGTYTLTESTNNVYRSVNFTGFAGTIGGTARTIYGSFTLSSGMTLTAATSVTTFAATSGTQQITTAAKTIDFPLTFNGLGGTFAFQDALTQGSTRAFTMTAGAVQLKNGTTNTVGSFVTSTTANKFLLSTTSGVQATISQASGTVSAQYLQIQDSNATGGATWNATNSADLGNNTGWNITAPFWYVDSRVEAFTSADVQSSTQIQNSSITEIVLSGESQTAQVNFSAVIVEDSQPLSLEDTTNNVFNSVATENTILNDIQTAVSAFNSAIVESSTLADAELVEKILFGAVVEDAVYADAQSSQANFQSNTTENFTSAEIETTQVNFNSAKVEGFTIIDESIGRGWFRVVDTQNPNWTPVNNTQI
jgi:hypothetical protein